MNTLDDLKLYCLNITSATVVSLGWLEPVLSILLLLTTLGYTAHKWYLLKNKKWEILKKLLFTAQLQEKAKI